MTVAARAHAVQALPEPWADGVSRLREMRAPATVPSGAWTMLLVATTALIGGGFAWKAAGLGWDDVALWGCHPARPMQRVDLAGALWLIGSDEITSVTPTAIALRTRTRAPLMIYRRRARAGEPIVLAWDLPQ